MKLKTLLFVIALITGFTAASYGQIAIPNTTAVTQNFDGMGSSTTATLLSNWKMTPEGGGTQAWADVSNSTATNQQASSGSPVTGGRYNWGNGTTTTDRAIGFMTSGSYSNPNSIMAFFQNTSGVQINDLTISFDYERYRIHAAACSITFFTSTDGSTWTAQTAGDSGAFSTGGSSHTFTGGTVISKSFTLSGINIANGANLYLRWNFNTTGSNSQGTGIDNLSVAATFSPPGILSIATGNWSDPATWTGGNVPDANESAVIQNGHVVTVDNASYRVRDAGTTTTVNAGGTLATGSLTYANNGTTNINGTFEISAGGYADGANLIYGASSTLNFNTSGTFNFANTHTFWPVTNGPKNVNIATATTVVMASNANRTISAGGILSVAGGLTLTSNPTITVNGTLRLDTGGYLSAGAMPVYGNASALLYNTGNTYGRGLEWNASGVGTVGTTPGYPNHVQLSNNTTLNYINGAASGTVGSKAIAGDLTIDAGSALHVNYGSVSAGGELVVAGNVTNSGTLTLGYAAGDDLRITGNFTNTGTFNGNNRAIYFNKTGTQTVTSSSTLTIPYLLTAGSGTTVQLAAGTNVTVAAPSAGNAIVFGNASDVIDINGNTLTIGTASVANTISGTGTFKGSTAYYMTLLVTGSLGTVNFTTDFQNLGSLVMNRQNGQTGCVMGTPVTINNGVTLTAGLIDLNNTTMTLASTVALPAGSVNSYVIADVSAGGVLRKNITGTGSQIFPVGSGGTQYTPATVNITSATVSGAYLGMAVENSKDPLMDAASIYLNRYWVLTSSGITSPVYTFTGTYLAGDVNGGTTGNDSNQHNGTTWLDNGATIAGTVVINGTTLSGGDHYTSGSRDPVINIRAASGGLGNITCGNISTTNSLQNTAFGSVNLGSNVTKDFEIQNTGTTQLTLTGTPLVSIGGDNSGDFVVTTIPVASSIAPSSSTTFIITFTPQAAGIRSAIVSVANNDSDKNPYTYLINGTGVCLETGNTVTPTSGPAGTIVTITATVNTLSGATLTLNSVAVTPITQVSATQIKFTVPSGAINGAGALITTNSQGCQASNSFTVMVNATSTCQGGTNVSDLFISEVTNATFGGMSYVEIYNGTGTTKNLSNYSLKIANNGGAYVFTLAFNNVTLASGSSYVVAVDGNVFCDTLGGDGSYAAQISSGGSINFIASGNDHIGLFSGITLIDSWGTFANQNWAASLGIGDRGADFRRKNTATVPNATYSNLDWDVVDWIGSGLVSCATNDYSNIGTFNFLAGTPPTVTAHPAYTPTCKAITLTVAGTEGFSGGNALAYQWYAVAPSTATWSALTDGGLYSGTTTATLNIADVATLTGYQFYCQLRENSATCYVASNAVMITAGQSTTWSGSAWSNGAPTTNTAVVINGNYNTSSYGSFEACSVTVNGGFTLNIESANYVSILNDLTVNATATLLVQDDGSLVMVKEAGVVTNNGTTQVNRTTAPFELYDYSYWATPVNGANIMSTFTGWRTDYSFEFNAANYSDTNTINYNGTVTAAGVPDSFDDYAPWAWLPYTGNMTNGKGYAIMGPTSLAFGPSATTTVTFSGAVNNGVVSINIVESENVANTADDFNLIGNPYASAISADSFILTNGIKISGSLYFWTHVGNVSVSNPGPNTYNFISDDYAVYNLSGGTRASLTGSAVPTGYIASGQGFFVESQGNNTLTFNNAMRNKNYGNSQYFRNSQPLAAEKDRLWLNLTNSDGMFGQLLVAYFPETTLDFDWAYDAKVNQSNNYLNFYTLSNNEKYKIQARATFGETDIVPIGYFSSVAGGFNISIDAQEGVLSTETTNIYLEDLEMNLLHNLKETPYAFTTGIGRFENRFLLRYTDGSALDNPNFDTLNNSVVVLTNQGALTIKSYIQPIAEVMVYDMLGRQLFQAKVMGAHDFLTDAISLSQQPLIVKIKLESGTVVAKKVLMMN